MKRSNVDETQYKQCKNDKEIQVYEFIKGIVYSMNMNISIIDEVCEFAGIVKEVSHIKTSLNTILSKVCRKNMIIRSFICMSIKSDSNETNNDIVEDGGKFFEFSDGEDDKKDFSSLRDEDSFSSVKENFSETNSIHDVNGSSGKINDSLVNNYPNMNNVDQKKNFCDKKVLNENSEIFEDNYTEKNDVDISKLNPNFGGPFNPSDSSMVQTSSTTRRTANITYECDRYRKLLQNEFHSDKNDDERFIKEDTSMSENVMKKSPGQKFTDDDISAIENLVSIYSNSTGLNENTEKPPRDQLTKIPFENSQKHAANIQQQRTTHHGYYFKTQHVTGSYLNHYYGSNHEYERGIKRIKKRYGCTVSNCNKSFTSAFGLRYHMTHGHTIEKESAVRPYRCPIKNCDKKYKNNNGLKYHLCVFHKINFAY